MKTLLLHAFAATIFLCASMCGCGEEYEYVAYTVEEPDLIVIENDQRSFDKNDTLWVNITVPNSLTDTQGNTRNVNELTNAEVAYTTFKLYQSNEYEAPAEIRLVETDFVMDAGEVTVNEFDTAFQTYAQLNGNAYSCRFGIKLATPGAFYLGPQHPDTRIVPYFDGISKNNVVYDISLTTTIKGVDEHGRYVFTVSE